MSAMIPGDNWFVIYQRDGGPDLWARIVCWTVEDFGTPIAWIAERGQLQQAPTVMGLFKFAGYGHDKEKDE